MNLEMQFHQEMLNIYAEADKFGYRPTRFLQMVNEHGGLQAAKLLLGRDAPSDGFERLWEEGRLDLSVEALVLREPWCGLFTHEELSEAYRRLQGSDYDAGGNREVAASSISSDASLHCSISMAMRTVYAGRVLE